MWNQFSLFVVKYRPKDSEFKPFSKGQKLNLVKNSKGLGIACASSKTTPN